jgi:hypothetical protein
MAGAPFVMSRPAMVAQPADLERAFRPPSPLLPVTPQNMAEWKYSADVLVQRRAIVSATSDEH